MTENSLDGTVTWEEAIGITHGMKIMTLNKPLVVNKPIGAIKIGDLPTKDEIVDSMNKKVQFSDASMDYECDLASNSSKLCSSSRGTAISLSQSR